MRHLAGLLLVCICLAGGARAQTCPCDSCDANQKYNCGEWSAIAPGNWPGTSPNQLVPVHMVLTKTGKLLMWKNTIATTATAHYWDPATFASTALPITTPAESTLFCAGHNVLSDTIVKIWHAFGLQPHRSETFKLSADPLCIEKVRDIVGLYLNPPDRALGLCVDEKSQIQALDRTQPLLPLRPGQVERRTHDYRRYGTTTLFAALDAKTGKVIGKCQKRHRAIEFRKFLNTIDASVPQDLDIHVILDNYGTHKTPSIHRWLLKHPRFHLHFTPTGASWINLVERWFGKLTEKQIRRGVHRSTDELVTAITAYLDVTNEHPKAFIWTKTADEIFAAITRFCLRTSNSGH